MTGVVAVLITTFLASAVEAIEMVTIVIGVGATRGWRSTLIGAASGFGVLAVVVVVLGAALSQVPIGPLRLIIGALLLTFGAGSNQLGTAVVSGVGAIVIVGAVGFSLHQTVRRIPRSLLQLIVGVLLSTFGSFWAIEGLGIEWPGGDAAIPGLLILYAATAATYITLERNRALGLRPAA